MNNKLGIVIPYRNRYEQLLIFKKSIISYLKNKDIDFELIIVEQDNAKEFNRGKLLNVGFTYAKKLKCNYVVFHDVDMLPVDVDYSYSDIPLQLANNFISEDGFSRLLFDEYFGGVTMFSVEDFETINGYSNEYWGWGYEDNDLLFRCKQYNLPLELKEFQSMGGNTAALKLNGENAFVEFKNVIEPTGNYTIFISFYPDDINCKFGDYDDTYSRVSCMPRMLLLVLNILLRQ
jgi:predicted glycosyltransferase involved in capsule biosynthesis